MSCSVSSYATFDVTADGATRTVYHRGSGAPVIVLHELPGLSPDCVSLAERLIGDRFHVYMPLLFGSACQDQSAQSFAKLCVTREFHLFATNETSPIATWLRQCCRAVAAQTPNQAIGVIGLCLTGNLALVLIAEASVRAAVSSEPALPMPLLPGYRKSLGISPDDLALSRRAVQHGERRILALRFRGDMLCTDQRFTTIKREFGGAVEEIVIPSPDDPHGIGKCAHAVLTTEYRADATHPTHLAYQRVVAFLRENL